MRDDNKFSFFSFLLIILDIIVVISLGVGVAYIVNYMQANDVTIQDGVEEVKLSLKKVTENFSNSETKNDISLTPGETPETYTFQIRKEEIVSDYYFYNQLTDNGKIIYNTIEGNLDKMQSGVYTIDFGTKFNEDLQNERGKKQLKIDFQAAWDALSLDNPKVFFIDVTKLYLTIEGSTIDGQTTYTAYIGPDQDVSYLIDGVKGKNIKEYQNQLEAIRNNVIQHINGSDYEKAKQIHDLLVDELEYDQTLNTVHAHDIYGALVKKCVVCEGYAKAYKYLLDGLGIPCVLVSGKATNSKGETEEHIWNYVLLDNSWYAVDVTWDDPVITGGILTNKIKYKYFLKGGPEFNTNHTYNNYLSNNKFKFEYPNLSNNDY